MTDPRIYAYVPEGIQGRLDEYIQPLGLKTHSALLGLLIAREVRQRRLGSLAPASRSLVKTKKVVPALSDELMDSFTAIASELGRSRTDCAADLLFYELEERWLEKAVEAL